MNKTANFLTAQSRNHSLNLTPVAEARDISLVAAVLRASGCFEAGVVAKALHQIGRIGESYASMNEGNVHPSAINAPLVSRLPTNIVNN